MRRQQPTACDNLPWNREKIIGQKPPLKLREVWSTRVRLRIADRLRDLALFNLAIDSKLRGCDLVVLRVGDVAQSGKVKSRAVVLQRKTGRPVQFEITEPTRDSVAAWIHASGRRQNDPLFPCWAQPGQPMTTREYARLVARRRIGLEPPVYGTRSLRRTKPALTYRRTGNVRAVEILLSLTKPESTVRYLGIEVYAALAIAGQVVV